MNLFEEKKINGLQVRVTGQGLPLIMLHGWGMHSSMLEELAKEMSQRFQVMLVDLPGHGQSAPNEFTLQSISKALSALVAEPAHWLGWSLGGSIAMNVSLHYPRQIASLILVSATPRFVCTENWDCGVSESVLNRFADDLASDYAGTMKRFLLLQTLGSNQARTAFRMMQEKIGSVTPPDKKALESGLEILRTTDLRTDISRFEFPVQVILGEKDTLVPVEVGEFYRKNIPSVMVDVIAGAGHVPFVSHKEKFVQLMNRHADQFVSA